ncbi:hypothetical protein TNCV_5085341 [Trichonephila clavipes]|uniref:Uncharacterized protein n=1 Tax=Trichonephila clavipes TaxID=2585209 RepID=A0A8X6S5R4_TRICX|nr:hypothetical protein TNCV_5085341 [Trichonephila clavipes]
MIKSIARKCKQQFYGNKVTKTSKNNSTLTSVPECTASSSKLGNQSLSTAEEMPGPVFGNIIVDLEIIVEAFIQLCCTKCFAEKIEKRAAFYLLARGGETASAGPASVNGCVAAISVDTGKVLDVEVICRPTVLHTRDFRQCQETQNMSRQKPTTYGNVTSQDFRQKWKLWGLHEYFFVQKETGDFNTLNVMGMVTQKLS